MEQYPDAKLIALSLQANAEATTCLLRRYSKRIFAVCYGIVGKADDAEDLAQECLIRGFSQLQRLKDRNQLYAWLVQIARNLCIDFLRKTQRRENPNENPLMEATYGESINPDHFALREALEKLPETLREPLVLYYLGQENTNEIAATLNITQATVHTRLSRARKELRRIMAGEENLQ